MGIDYDGSFLRTPYPASHFSGAQKLLVLKFLTMDIPMNVSEALALLKLVGEWVKEARKNHMSKRDRLRVQEEANRVIQLAMPAEIDKYITEPRQHIIDQHVGPSPRQKSAAEKAARKKGGTFKKSATRRSH